MEVSAMQIAEQPSSDIVRDAEAISEKLGTARAAISARIYGQDDVIEQALVTLLAGGHALLIGVPGLAKTKLVKTMGAVLGLDANRIQFTPDLMPSDILGSEVLEESESGKRHFRFIAGPVFCQLLMADEINRASPRTQSALLQAMEEHEVSIAGETRPLPTPFHVLATQNPLEQEGTYPLPEAQLDRFLLQIDVDYPAEEAERQMLLETTGPDHGAPERVLGPDDLLTAQRLVRDMPVGELVVDSILGIVRAGREDGDADPDLAGKIAWPPGPRAAQALMLTARARALLKGRFAPSMDDVLHLARSALKHRMEISYGARADGDSVDDVIDRLCAPYV